MALIYGVLSLSYQTWIYRCVMGPGWLRAISCMVAGTVLYYILLAIALVAFFAARGGLQ